MADKKLEFKKPGDPGYGRNIQKIKEETALILYGPMISGKKGGRLRLPFFSLKLAWPRSLVLKCHLAIGNLNAADLEGRCRAETVEARIA